MDSDSNTFLEAVLTNYIKSYCLWVNFITNKLLWKIAQNTHTVTPSKGYREQYLPYALSAALAGFVQAEKFSFMNPAMLTL